ncbi:MAG: type II secretion system protein N [Sphingomonas sp. 32-62-10]|nr:MAG: type II secretion system protein N [Sphingomonas sp. 32-62-10]
MMKIRLDTRPAVLFGGLTLLGLLVFLPMRLVLGLVGLGEYGLSARAVTGPVWYGQLMEARLGDLSLGDLRARLSPFQLLLGRARLDLNGPAQGDKPGLVGAISTSRYGFGIDDMTGSVPTGSVFAPLPINRIELEGVSIRFDSGACAVAQGRVKAQLSGAIATVPLPQAMSGTVKCEGGALIVPLVSQAGTESVTLSIRANGRYRATLDIQSSDPAVAQKLGLVGFQQAGAGYRLSTEGQF